MNATTQCLWLQGIFGEFEIESDTSTVIYCDNQINIRISTDLVHRQQTKHIDIHMHYIRGLVHDGIIALHYCTSSEKVGDIFTKEFSQKTFNNLKSLLGIDDLLIKFSLMPTWTCGGPTSCHWCHQVPLAVHKYGWSQYPYSQWLGTHIEFVCGLKHLVPS